MWKDWQADPTVHFPRRAALSAPASKPAAGNIIPTKQGAPAKATLLEPRTTLDDTRAVRPDLASRGAGEPDTRIKLPSSPPGQTEADLVKTVERRPTVRTLLGVPQLSEPGSDRKSVV